MRNTQKRFRYISTFTLVTLAALVLASCADSPLGVFQSIELERKIIDDRELNNELVVGSVTRSGSKYFIAAGTLWHRDVTDPNYLEGVVAEWQQTLAPGSSNSTTSSLVPFSGSGSELVYAAYSSQDGLSGGIYTVDPGDVPIQVESGSIVFAFDANSASGDYTPDRVGMGPVFVVDDGTPYLLVVVQKSGVSQYTLFSSSDGTTFTEVADLQTSQPVIDVASPSAGTAIAYLTEKRLYLDSDGIGSGAPVDVTANIPVGDRTPVFGGIYYQQSSGLLWLSDNQGFLYRSTDLGATSGNWSVNSAAYLRREDGPALRFADVISLDAGGTEVLIAGTKGSGYREVTESSGEYSTSIPDAVGSNYQSSDLAQAAILSFYVDPGVTRYTPTQTETAPVEKSGDLLFAGTSSLGLWKGLFTDEPVQWVQE